MNLYDTIMARRTIHNYVAQPVPETVIDRILLAAHQAPNHRLTWPWRFTVVGPATREKLMPIACELKKAKSDAMVQRIRNKLINPGALIVVTQIKCDDAFQSKEDYAATCCAIQNILLAATAEGYGSKWSTGGLTQHPSVCEALQIESETETVVGFIWVGRAEKTPVVERPDLEQHVKKLA